MIYSTIKDNIEQKQGNHNRNKYFFINFFVVAFFLRFLGGETHTLEKKTQKSCNERAEGQRKRLLRWPPVTLTLALLLKLLQTEPWACC